MIELYGDLGVVGYKPGIADDPDFPPDMYVESKPFAPGGTAMLKTIPCSTAVPVRRIGGLAVCDDGGIE